MLYACGAFLVVSMFIAVASIFRLRVQEASWEDKEWQRTLWCACLYAWVAGYVDTACYEKFRAFPSMMAGNVIFLGHSFMTGRSGELGAEWWFSNEHCFYIATILLFALGCVACRLADRFCRAARTLASVVTWPTFVCLSVRACTLGYSPRSYVWFLAVSLGMEHGVLMRGTAAAFPGACTGGLMMMGDLLVVWLAGDRRQLPKEQKRHALLVLANAVFLLTGVMSAALMMENPWMAEKGWLLAPLCLRAIMLPLEVFIFGD